MQKNIYLPYVKTFSSLLALYWCQRSGYPNISFTLYFCVVNHEVLNAHIFQNYS